MVYLYLLITRTAITRIIVFFLIVFSLFLPAGRVHAEDVDLSISAQVKGLGLEFPLSNVNGTFTGSEILSIVKFGGNTPLIITEKKGLTTDSASDPVVSILNVTPTPLISLTDPLVTTNRNVPTEQNSWTAPLDTASPAAVIIQDSSTKLLLDSFPTPTATVTPLPTRTPTSTPVMVEAQNASTNPVQLSNGGLDAETLFAMSNAHRQSIGLAPFQKDARACELAAARAPEINAEIANGNMHAGMYGRGLPYWNTENIISMGSEQAAFNWWINDPIHRDAIQGNYAYSCVACSGNACAQEFTNFQPK